MTWCYSLSCVCPTTRAFARRTLCLGSQPLDSKFLFLSLHQPQLTFTLFSHFPDLPFEFDIQTWLTVSWISSLSTPSGVWRYVLISSSTHFAFHPPHIDTYQSASIPSDSIESHVDLTCLGRCHFRCQFRPPGCAHGNGTRISHPVQQIHEIQPKEPRLDQSRPLCALVSADSIPFPG